MALILEYRSNNGNDTIVLVDTNFNLVRSRWDVTTNAVSDFADCTVAAEDWDDHYGDEHAPEEYGDLVATRARYNLIVADIPVWERAVGFVEVARRHARS